MRDLRDILRDGHATTQNNISCIHQLLFHRELQNKRRFFLQFQLGRSQKKNRQKKTCHFKTQTSLRSFSNFPLFSANETLLRTLLSYCSLHGASGGGLASVRMELVLLLQELQQEKTQQTLLSPLPFPTTLPLLSASVACNKTVVADPVRHLQVSIQGLYATWKCHGI
jgi:hypothetical protein